MVLHILIFLDLSHPPAIFPIYNPHVASSLSSRAKHGGNTLSPSSKTRPIGMLFYDLELAPSGNLMRQNERKLVFPTQVALGTTSNGPQEAKI